MEVSKLIRMAYALKSTGMGSLLLLQYTSVFIAKNESYTKPQELPLVAVKLLVAISIELSEKNQ